MQMDILDKLDNLDIEFKEVQKRESNRESMFENYIESNRGSITKLIEIDTISPKNNENNDEKIIKEHNTNIPRKSLLGSN